MIKEWIQCCFSKTENNVISNLLLVEINLTKNINNKYKREDIIYLSTSCMSCFVDGCFNKRLVFQ